MKQRDDKRQGENKADGTAEQKTKPMSNTTIIVLCVAVPLLLSGFANYFAHKPWILYIPLIGLSLLVFYIGHLCIRSYAYPHTLDKPTAAPLESAAPTPSPMKEKQTNITTGDITSVNQSGGFTGVNQGTVNSGTNPPDSPTPTP